MTPWNPRTLMEHVDPIPNRESAWEAANAIDAASEDLGLKRGYTVVILDLGQREARYACMPVPDEDHQFCGHA